MNIEIPSELAEHIANLCDVWGSDHRPAFVADIEDRIRQSAGALGLGGKINDRLFINAHAATGRNKWSGGVSVTIR